MSEVVPPPHENDVPVNQPVGATLNGGERATFTYEPGQQTTPGFVIPTVAISKFPDSSYSVYFDDQQVFGPAPVPPTDIDDLGVTFLPAYEFEEELRVVVENLSGSTTRQYVAQPVGFEKVAERTGGEQ